MPYSIIGADEREYGPVDSQTLVKWAIEGRVVERTELRDHDSGRRFLACDMQELDAVFNPPPALHSSTTAQTFVPTYVSMPAPVQYYTAPKSKIVAGILGITLGFLGVHRFYLGYTAIGVIQLMMSTVLALFSCGLTLLVAAIWGFVEGIICLVGGMPDANGRPLST